MSSTASTTTKNPDSSFGYSHESFSRFHNEFDRSLVINETQSNVSGPSKGLAFYLLNPNELRTDHPIWHYFYLCTLIFAAFVSLFIGPVIFGMLAAIGGVGTPLALSFVGGGIGLLLGLVFGVVFSVVCIVALVKALGMAAEWVLDALWSGGSDLMLITKEQILYLINTQE
ncbi:13587_t:CDS:2 [Acaulospora morrowiae]|uniref:13587_t:CDS:1 n=1 Tax=Acaulospora morrowiae TaxID=94023 RepID=A0A9N8VE87_9GLOM|nr:13587_t:CDS:2 [Acaulospora morrowiae]